MTLGPLDLGEHHPLHKHHASAMLFSVQLVFVGYQILTKVALTSAGFDPIMFALVRSLGTSLLLLAVATYTSGRQTRCFCAAPSAIMAALKLPWAHQWRFLLLGFSMACNVLGLICALEHTTSGMVAILQVLRPVFASLLSWALGLEFFTMQKIVGMLVCFVGALVITLAGVPVQLSHVPDLDSLLGVFFVCIHALGQVGYVIQQPYFLDAGYSGVTTNGIAFLVASLFFLALLPLPFHSGLWHQPTFDFWLNVVYSILFVGAYCYVAMGWAAKHIGATAVMLSMLLQACLTVLAGKIFLQEQMQLQQIVGAAFVFIGIMIFASGPEVSGSASERERLAAKPQDGISNYDADRK